MHRNIYTTNINNEVLSLSFAHCLKKHADFDVPESDRNNTQFNTFLQDSFCLSMFWCCFFFEGDVHDYHLLFEQWFGVLDFYHLSIILFFF